MDKNGLYPIYGTWHELFWQTKIFYRSLIALLVALFLLLLFFLLRKCLIKKNKKKSWEKALFELEKLKKFINEGKVTSKELYLSLTSLLKTYFHDRYGFDLFGKTDDEIIAFLENNKFDKDLLTNMREMFQDSREVKFANAKALIDYIERDLKLCIDVVNKTIPSPSP